MTLRDAGEGDGDEADAADLSDELPSSRADAVVLHESTGLQFHVTVGPLRAGARAQAQTFPASPSALATTTLLLATAAGVPAGLFVVAGAFLGAPAELVVGVAALLFLVVFATGVTLVARGPLPGDAPPGVPGPRTHHRHPGPAGSVRGSRDAAGPHTVGRAAAAGRRREH